MTDTKMIVDVAARLFTERVNKHLLDLAEAGEFPVALWQAICDTGFNEIGSADSGTGYPELFALLRCAGEQVVPLPLAETLLAGTWAGPHEGISSIGRIDGDKIVDVPWGRAASRVIGISPDSLNARIVTDVKVLEESANLAGEARDTVQLPANADAIQLDIDPVLLLATSQAVQMAGAMTSILAMTITYATDREQFGRPISKFQVIQHVLAQIAAEVAAAKRAADAAAGAVELADGFVDVAAARSRVGEAAGVVAELSHQVHGAMGFTHEHKLHHYTRRLWAWRDEYGNESYWQARLGEALAQQGADAVWSFIAARS
ncbi:MAG: acyl-CoA dehydrogenase family protein [Pseudomonadota bacterium]